MGGCDTRVPAARGAVELLSRLGLWRGLVGVGTGSTVAAFLREAGERLGEAEGLVASSMSTALGLASRGLRVLSPAVVGSLDVYVDGADEVDGEGRLLKGRGAALLGEKILAYASRVNVFIVGEEKLVDALGSRRPLPVEVVPDALASTLERIRSRWPGASPREAGGKDGPVVSDWGGVIVDVPTGPMRDPVEVDSWLRRLPGVVETGLFIGLADYVVVGMRDCSWRVLSFEREVP